jgi:hypothetical protein
VISFKINNVPTLFIKAFTAADVQRILDFVRDAAALSTAGTNTVLFIDTPITASTVEAVQKLKREGYRVVFRDHHGIDGEPMNDRDRQVKLANATLVQSLGDDCQITVRRLHPACSTLVNIGEFEDAIAIIADPDADGLTAAMKAAGISYPGLDDDAAKLDGEPYLQVTGTPISQLLAKGVATLPSFDANDPTRREQAQQQLFSDWVEAVKGNTKAQDRLQTVVAAYDEAVKVSEELATTATEVAPGVVLVNCVGQPIYDVGTLTSILERSSGCLVTVLRKELGPIAALHGIQYSLAVAKAHQKTISLQTLVPPESKSDPLFGIISNVSFLLHVSQEVWDEQVLPQLNGLAKQYAVPLQKQP